MLLVEIKDYIRTQKEVTLQRLSQQFNIPDQAMRDMVKIWVTKGVVIEEYLISGSNCQVPSACGSGCSGCSVKEVKDVIQYRWREV